MAAREASRQPLRRTGGGDGIGETRGARSPASTGRVAPPVLMSQANTETEHQMSKRSNVIHMAGWPYNVEIEGGITGQRALAWIEGSHTDLVRLYAQGADDMPQEVRGDLWTAVTALSRAMSDLSEYLEGGSAA